MLKKCALAFVTTMILSLAPSSTLSAQDKVEVLHRQASQAYQSGTVEGLSRAASLWTEALALCEQRRRCARQIQINRNVSASYLGLAELDSALAYSGEVLRLQNSPLLYDAHLLVSQAPTSDIPDVPDSEAFVRSANTIIKASLPLDATAGLLPESPQEAVAALDALVSSGIAVQISIQSDPGGMEVRFRERPRPGVSPAPWNYTTTQHTKEHHLFYMKQVQICYGNGAATRMVIQDCGNGCQVRIPRDDATPGCTSE